MKDIKTVADLISALSVLPQDARILVQGYEGGFSEIDSAKSVLVELDYYKEDWNGPHETTENASESAVVLLRKESRL